MKCESARDLTESYLDGELDPGLKWEIQEHFATCNYCAEIHSQFRELQTDIRTQALYYMAPAYVQERVLKALRQAAENEAANSGATRLFVSWKWTAIAASILLVASLALNFTLFRSRDTGRDTIAGNVFSSHVRSLIGTHLLDVPSSDEHTVKPWAFVY